MRGPRLVGALVAAAAVGMAQLATAGAATAMPEHGYATDTMRLPTTSSKAAGLSRDLDGDGSRDNRLGQFYAELHAHGLDMADFQNAAIQAGDIVMLHALRASSFASTQNATWQVLYGAPTADPDFSGSGQFTVGGADSLRLPAQIKDHRVRTDPGKIPVRLQAEGPLTLQVLKARVLATCTRASCSGGRINGAVSRAQVNNKLVPELATLFTRWVERDCTMGASGCMSGSQGQAIVALFDEDEDGTITEDEISTNPTFGPFLKPDLDLAEPKGKDAVSFGFGFTAVRAQLVR